MECQNNQECLVSYLSSLVEICDFKREVTVKVERDLGETFPQQQQVFEEINTSLSSSMLGTNNQDNL